MNPDLAQELATDKRERALWPAPGKLNLFLHIIGQREDGYHLLQTVFQFIGLSDQLRISANDSGEIAAKHQLSGVSPSDDLTLKAARLLQQETGCTSGAEIELIKNIPVGGGIGGGSSDAATVLLVLNQLWGTGLSESQLKGLGLQLGADVPVFIHGNACWAEGVGEHFQDVTLPEPVYLVIYPRVHVSTAEIFAAGELTRDTPTIRIADFLAGRAGNSDPPPGDNPDRGQQVEAAPGEGEGGHENVTPAARNEANLEGWFL